MAKYTSRFTGPEIDAKYGYARMSATINEQNFYSLELFASKADADLYDEDPEANASLATIVTIPISTVQGDAYASLLTTSVETTASIISTKETLMIPLNFRGVKISQIGSENAGVTGTLTIQRRVAGGDWVTAVTMTNVLTSYNYTETNKYQEVDIASALVNGNQEIRVRASFDYEDVDGSVKTAYSAWVMVGKSITKTLLNLELSTDYSQPISLVDVNGNITNFVVNYIPRGELSKRLHFKVTGSLGTYTTVTTVNENGSVVAGCNVNVSQNDTYGLRTHGIKFVEAYLEAEDGMGNTITSNVLRNQFMVVEDPTNTKPYLLLQNVITDAVNYMQADICEYAIYSPSDEGVKIALLMTGYSNDYEGDRPEEYFRLEQEVKPRTQQKLTATIEIETESTEDSFAYFRVRRISGDRETDFIQESTGDTSYYTITVDNKSAFTPVAGATFLINPKVRSNNEDNPARIINSRDDNKEVTATFEGFGFITDGWVESSGQRVLRIPAGGKLTIKRDLWARFRQNPDTQLNFEIDFAVHNITNTTDPIIDISENTATGFKGLRMNALDGWLKSKSYSVSDDCLFSWQEDKRTHLFINIENIVQPQGPDVTYNGDYNAIPDPSDPTRFISRVAIARVFMDGDCVREIPFKIDDTTEWSDTGCDIIIGNEGVDIDIYSFRAYEAENRNITPRSILMRNYIATMPTREAKQDLFLRNNITDGNGRISLEAAKALGLNCMVWHGVLPSKINDGEYKGWYEYFRYDDNRQLMKDYSGTNCKASGQNNLITEDDKPLTGKGQGSTAKTYYDWNIQDDNSKVKTTIQVPVGNFHESITLSEPYDKDGKQWVDIYGGNLGKNFPVEEVAQPYEYSNGLVTVPDGWIDGNGKYRGMGYMVAPDTALAQKKVIKVNYASSMQSHLLGACKTYDLLHRAVVGNTPLQDRVPTAVSAKHTEPFLLFHEVNGNVYFKGMGNYGAAKMDKVAWGYAKKLHPNFALIEGSDNNMTLTDFRVPFDKNTAIYNCSEEYWEYNGVGSFDYDGGATVEYTGDEDSIEIQMAQGWKFKDATSKSEAPSANIRDRWAFVVNYIYLHGTNIKFHNGTYSDFIAKFNTATDDEKADFLASKMWFPLADGDYKAFCLYRYDALTQRWINAGLLGADDKYREVNLSTDVITKTAYENNKGNFDNMNEAFKAAYAKHMHDTIKYVINEESLIFNYCYVLSLLAGTDNSSKNTYYKLMPYPVAFVRDEAFNAWYKGAFGAADDFNFSYVYQVYLDGDDMDSILRTNNNSHQTKPYYIERRFPFADENPTECLYEGMKNQLFNYVEQWAKGDAQMLPNMLNRILTAAANLVSDNDHLFGLSSNKKSAWGFLHKYFFNTQYYFPQVCYNEQARIRYEFPHMIGYISSGSGARSIAPISQSLGSQLQNELQYMKQRLVYMASYARWSALCGTSGVLGITDEVPTLSFTGSGIAYKFVLKSYQYIYPTFNSGQSKINIDKRLKPNEPFEYTLNTGGETGDAGIGLYAIDYYTSIGNVGDFAATNATFTLQGKRLREFIAEPTSGAPFAPQKIDVKAAQLDTFSLKGCTGIAGALDLSVLTRVQTIDLTGTKLYEVGIPYSANLTSIKLGDSIQRLVLDNTPNLETMRLESFDKLQSLSIGDNVGTSIDTKGLVVNLYSAKTANATESTLPLTYLSLNKVDWNDFDIAVLTWLTDDVTNLNLTGRISMKEPSQTTSNINFDIKSRINAKFGNVDSEDSALRIIYNVIPLTGITLQGSFNFGPEYPQNTGIAQFGVYPQPSTNANNQMSIVYEIVEHPQFSTVSIDSTTGVLTATNLSVSEDFVTIKATVYTNNNTHTSSKKVPVWSRDAVLGDAVYNDGTYSSFDYVDELRQVIGVCVYATPRYTTTENGHNAGDINEELFNPKDKHRRLMSALNIPTITSSKGTLFGGGSYTLWGIARQGSVGNITTDGKLITIPGVFEGEALYQIPTMLKVAGYAPTSSLRDESDIDNDGFARENNILDSYGRAIAKAYGFAYNESEEILASRTITNGLLSLSSEYYKEGDIVNAGYADTLKVIEHRNKVIQYGLEQVGLASDLLRVPSASANKTEMEDLAECFEEMKAWSTEKLNKTDFTWAAIYYPMVSMAYAYEPQVRKGIVLDNRFKSHNWFAPATGLMARLSWYIQNGNKIYSKAKDKGYTMIDNNISGFVATSNISTDPSSAYYGNFRTDTNTINYAYSRWQVQWRCLPICAF